MAGTTNKDGKNLGRSKNSGGFLSWILGACILVAGIIAVGATFLFFKNRKRQVKAGQTPQQVAAPAGQPQKGNVGGSFNAAIVNLDEY